MEANRLSETQLESLAGLSPLQKYNLFRETYPEFCYEGYSLETAGDALSITYHFRVPGLAAFAPSWTIPLPEGADLADGAVRRLIFSLGLVELVSYWKIACPPKVKILCGTISAEQADWWKEQYKEGLGEFFYRNGIPVTPDFMEIESEGEDFTAPAAGRETLSGCIIPVGGGKDSIVTLTLLSGMKEESFCYVMNSRGATEHSAEIAGYPPERRLNIRRTLAPEMLALNKQGYLNGHTPFSALVAFSGVLMAELYGKAYVVLSNESSANESTVKGLSVNHQYSKSFQFEADFDRYVKGFIGSRVQYFSLLRPWSEFQIAAYFAGLTAFHPYFRSCNAGSKTDSWCGKCAKCLFVALILTPFLPDEAIYGIFGREILEDTALIPTLQELCGETDEKPFECVGSREEIGCAMAIGIRAREAAGKKLPALLAYFKTSPAYPAAAADDSRFFRYYQEENLLPPAFDRMMREETRKLRERYCGGEG